MAVVFDWSRHQTRPGERGVDCTVGFSTPVVFRRVSKASSRRTLMMTASKIIISITDKNVFTNISTRNCSVINTTFLIKASVLVKKNQGS